MTGKGNLTFINNMKYYGSMKNGLLGSGLSNEKCQIIFSAVLNMKEKIQ